MKKTFLVILLFTTLASAMDKMTAFTNTRENVEYNPYLYSLTAINQDTNITCRMNESLFRHLCILASQEKNLNKEPFQELLEKIKNGKIKTYTPFELIELTCKDTFGRLLSYITHKQNEKINIFFQPQPTHDPNIPNILIGSGNYYFRTDRRLHDANEKEFITLLKD